MIRTNSGTMKVCVRLRERHFLTDIEHLSFRHDFQAIYNISRHDDSSS